MLYFFLYHEIGHLSKCVREILRDIRKVKYISKENQKNAPSCFNLKYAHLMV